MLTVFGIDLASRKGTITVRDGSLVGDDLSLRPVQWEGELRNGVTQPRQLSHAESVKPITLLDADIPDAGADGDSGWLATAPDEAGLVGDDLPLGPGDASRCQPLRSDS